jgi:glycosyltransferase involved in cell wall biosynthesis
MTSTPAISVITPVWNGLPYIKETIDSVLADEFQDWELLIGDNFSTDGTREYLETLSDPRIHVFLYEKNFGVYYSIRFLWSKARAPIAFGLCADDYLYPGALNKIITAWHNTSPETAYITYNWEHRMINFSRLTRYGYEALPKTLKYPDSSLGFFLFGNIPGNFSEVCVKVGLVNASENFVDHMKYSGDYEFWARLAKTNTVILSNEKVVYIRRHDKVAATFLNTKGEWFEDTLPVYEKLIDDLSPFYDRKKLITYYNIETRSFQLREALVAILKGKFANFKAFMNSKSSIFWPKWVQLIILLPFALYEGGRLRTCVILARNIVEHGKK